MKLKIAQETDQVGVVLPAGTEVTRLEDGSYVDAEGRICWPKDDEVE